MKNKSLKVDVRVIEYSSAEYKQELELRDLVLRKPLGMSVYNDRLEQDEADVHVGAFASEVLIAVLLLTHIDNRTVKMRQVAVAPEFQSQGVGRKMLIFAEKLAQNKGYERISLHARKTAVQFYLQNGYSITGEEFLEINIPHFEMNKRL